jgi:rod shape-determining protein MreB
MRTDIFSRVTPKIGIDLGTTRTRIWSSETGFVVDEATCLAVDQKTGKVVAVGDEAAAMQGRVSDTIAILRPIEEGEMRDYELTQALLRVLLQRVFTTITFFRPLVMVSIPASLSPAKREVLVESLFAVGAKEVFTMSQPLAAAIGAGVPIADASGTFLFHLGGGVVEAAVISLGSVVVGDDTTKAGVYIDHQLALETKKSHDLIVSLRTAEMLKQMVASLDAKATRELLTSGQDLHRGSPKEVMVHAESLQPVLKPVAEHFSQLLQRMLSDIPPELTVDVIDKGLLLTGGMAQLHGLVEYLVESLGVPVAAVDEPSKAVIKGLATALEHLEEFRDSLGYRV